MPLSLRSPVPSLTHMNLPPVRTSRTIHNSKPQLQSKGCLVSITYLLSSRVGGFSLFAMQGDPASPMGVLTIVATATDALGGQADARANVSVTLGTQDEQGHQAAYAAMEAHLNASLTRGSEQVRTLQHYPPYI